MLTFTKCVECLSLGFTSDLWSMPSPAAVLSIELTPAPTYLALVSPLLAATRSGLQNVTLGWKREMSQDLNFSVLAESSLQGPLFTIRIIQRVPRNNASWSMLLTVAVCSYSAVLSSVSVPAAATVSLLPACANSQASLLIFPSAGATVVPTSLTPIIAIGARGSIATCSFTCYAEDGSASPTFTLQLNVSKFDDLSWSMRVSGAGMAPLSLSSATAPQLTVVSFNYTAPTPISLNGTLVYWQSGVKCLVFPNSMGNNATQLRFSDDALPPARYQQAMWTGLDSDLYLFGNVGTVLCSVLLSSVVFLTYVLFGALLMPCTQAALPLWGMKVTSGVIRDRCVSGVGCKDPAEPTRV
jgi:hypothetical protein